MDSQNQGSEIECFDRISELPDDVLAKILSFLPTKNAVGASILSKRWKNLDPFRVFSIHLDFDDSVFIKPDFVDKLLNETLRGVPYVDKLTLNNDMYCDNDMMNSWVSAARELNVKTLILTLNYSRIETLLQSLNGFSSLARLDLVRSTYCYRGSRLFIPYDFSLPSLKQLRINLFTCNESIHELVNGCPVLEELEIVSCSFELEGRSLCIRSPKLKSLIIIYSWLGRSLELNVPKLEVFTFKGRDFLRDFVSNFESLTAAHIDFHLYSREADSIHYGKIIAACSNTKCLYISCDTITALHSSSLQLPKFEKLTRLSLDYVPIDRWSMFACLLRNAPMLEHLTFEKGFPNMMFESFERLVSSPSTHLEQTCLELHIKSAEFRRFDWEQNEVKVLNYFKQNGKVLKRVVLNSVVLLGK